MTSAADAWDPAQYERFKSERTAPFRDLLALVRAIDGGRAIDLGCGTGELTAQLHATIGARETVGVDSSRAMLERATAHEGGGLRFEYGDIATFGADGADATGFDVVFSNAALQWVGDHEGVLAQWAKALAPGGQLAVQVPANADHPSHLTAAAVAATEEFAADFGQAGPPPDVVRSVLAPERYATLLAELGFREQHVRLQVYGHWLGSTAEVVEWVKGTSLNRFRAAMAPDRFDVFVTRYREQLLAALGDYTPYFYPFKRILFCATK